jgi:hypothetical protein
VKSQRLKVHELVKRVPVNSGLASELFVALGFRPVKTELSLLVYDNETLVAEVRHRRPPIPKGPNYIREATDEQNEAYFRIDRPRLALHEAGHVYAALKLDLHFRSVDLPHGTNAGSCKIDFEPFNAEGYKNRQLCSAAGAAAETLEFGSYHAWGCSCDRSEVDADEVMRLQDLGVDVCADGFETPDVFDERVEHAKNILCMNEVRAIAHALDQREGLSPNDVKTVIQDVC